MNKYDVTVATFNKLADKYEEKYMNFNFYLDTYDKFCTLVSKPDSAIFEIACGPGNITKYLLDKRPDYKVLGTDLAPNMVKLAKQNNPAAVFEVMDSRNINTVKQTFDAIMCGFCLPYLSKSDSSKLIKDCRSLLNQDGILYLSTMEDDYDKSGFQTSSAGDQVYIHYHQLDYLQNQLQLNGFEIIEVKRKQFPVEQGVPATDLFIYAKAV